jgi:hypothetical protein
MVVAGSLQTSLSWLNIYAELLGVQSYSLWRIRAILAARTTSPDECEADVYLVMDEMERVRDRFRYWEDVVDACIK